MSAITFVTAFFNIYNYPLDSDFIQQNLNKFKEIAITGIKLCLYTEDVFIELFKNLIIEFPNIEIMPPINLKNSKISLICSKNNYGLPENRCAIKDNFDLMILLNSSPFFGKDSCTKHLIWSNTKGVMTI